MKTLYFDCSSGISGNMVLGALTEIIGDEQYLIEELKKLNMDGYKIEISKLAGVNKIIEESSLNEKVKDLAKRIFLRVAKSESKVHDKPLEEVHFHEVGAIDSIIDIVGTAILINKINPDKIISSIVNDGHGFIECAHGTMSVPVPATSEIFANSNVKFRQIDIETELVTPTGAAIIAELAEEFTTLPAITTEKIGWGSRKIISKWCFRCILYSNIYEEK